MISRRNIGNDAEDIASVFITSRGFSVIKRNFTCRFGEIDIIALHNHTLVFIEVRSKNSQMKGSPAESITVFKKRKIFKTAQYFLKCNAQYMDYSCRFDFIGIMDGNINHVRSFISEDELY